MANSRRVDGQLDMPAVGRTRRACQRHAKVLRTSMGCSRDLGKGLGLGSGCSRRRQAGCFTLESRGRPGCQLVPVAGCQLLLPWKLPRYLLTQGTLGTYPYVGTLKATEYSVHLLVCTKLMGAHQTRPSSEEPLGTAGDLSKSRNPQISAAWRDSPGLENH